MRVALAALLLVLFTSGCMFTGAVNKPQRVNRPAPPHRIVAGWDCTAHPENEEACDTAQSTPAPARTVTVTTTQAPAPAPTAATPDQCAAWNDQWVDAADEGSLSYDPTLAEHLRVLLLDECR